MSVWRIDKIDAQTRALAEAAAKAAGLPLGLWLERAIMRRVQKRQDDSPKLAAPADATPVAAPTPEISREMQAALEAAERRRRERSGVASETETDDAGLADPFAAPEQESDDAPFERPPGADAPAGTVAAPEASAIEDQAPLEDELTIEDDEPAIAVEPETPVEQIFVEPTGTAPAIAPTASGEVESARAPAATQSESADVKTTGRQPILPTTAPPPPVHRDRGPSGLTIAVLGLALIAAIGFGAWFYLVKPQNEPKQTAATAEPAGPAPAPSPAPAAKPPETAAAPATPPAASPPVGPPSAPAPAADAGATPPAASANVPPASPPSSSMASSPIDSAATPPASVGPSTVDLLLMNPGPAPAAADQTAATAPPPAAPATTETKPAVATELLPALRARAEAGALDAQMELGRRYLEGIGVGRNQSEAAKWLLRAAEQGDPQAQFNVGVMYENGIGLEGNVAKAVEYYRKSAAQKTPMAMHNLALLYAGDRPDFKPDAAQARKLMTDAAELGLAESQYSLALMHLQGIGGPRDPVAAMSWIVIAARPNKPQFAEAARQLVGQLGEAERQRARRLAEDHVRKIQANLRQLQAGQSAAVSQPTAADKPRVVDRAAIAEIQTLLASLRLYNAKADGAMGPRTAAAIKEFQAMAGIPADGKPSIELLESLREVAGMTKQ